MSPQQTAKTQRRRGHNGVWGRPRPHPVHCLFQGNRVPGVMARGRQGYVCVVCATAVGLPIGGRQGAVGVVGPAVVCCVSSRAPVAAWGLPPPSRLAVELSMKVGPGYLTQSLANQFLRWVPVGGGPGGGQYRGGRPRWGVFKCLHTPVPLKGLTSPPAGGDAGAPPPSPPPQPSRLTLCVHITGAAALNTSPPACAGCWVPLLS